MKRNHTLILAVALLALPLASRAADGPSPAELKMRDALKNTMLQLRNTQNDLATLQGADAEKDQKIKDLSDQLDALTKKSGDDKLASDKELAILNTKAAALDSQLTQYKKVLGDWQKQYKLAADTAKAKEAERAKLASEKIVLQRRVDDLESKNIELFHIGSDILERYEKFSLGQALAAKEPFVGTTKVKLENLVQDYQDKLADQKSTPQPAPPATK